MLIPEILPKDMTQALFFLNSKSIPKEGFFSNKTNAIYVTFSTFGLVEAGDNSTWVNVFHLVFYFY